MTATAPPSVFQLPQRGLFDVVAANDVTSLLTLVRGDNPFDVSPGMELIRSKKRSGHQPSPENPSVMATAELRVDVAQIARTRDAKGNGAAHVAASHGLAAMLEVLVDECGCAVDEYNETGLTPLHLAALHGHDECVRLLCDLGAEPLCITRSTTSADSVVDPFFCGRTTLFLAHCCQHTAVVSFLLPFYTPLAKSTCVGQSGTDVWHMAALQQNTQLLALLLDVVECAVTTVCPLPLTFGVNVVEGLEASVATLAVAALPTDQRISREQLFLFDRLVRLGYLRGDTAVSSRETVLDRVLSTAQVQAWRVLVESGAVQPHECDVEDIRSSGYPGNGESELRLLIEEAKAHAAYQKAKEHYELRGDNEARRSALLSSRAAWKALQHKRVQRHVAPVGSVRV